MIGSKEPTAQTLAAGIKLVTTDQAIAAAANQIGEQVRAEDGIGNAINFIDRVATTYPYSWPINR